MFLILILSISGNPAESLLAWTSPFITKDWLGCPVPRICLLHTLAKDLPARHRCQGPALASSLPRSCWPCLVVKALLVLTLCTIRRQGSPSSKSASSQHRSKYWGGAMTQAEVHLSLICTL